MKKKYEKKEEKNNDDKIHEPAVYYNKRRIVFSTIETQGDIQLEYALSVSPVERLRLMRKLNDYAFQNQKHKNILTSPIKLIFTSYEYTPS